VLNVWLWASIDTAMGHMKIDQTVTLFWEKISIADLKGGA
jgi:hypothetical protein